MNARQSKTLLRINRKMHSICSSIAYNVDTSKMIPKARVKKKKNAKEYITALYSIRARRWQQQISFQFDFNKSVKPEKNRQTNAINNVPAHLNRLCCAVNNFSYASTCAHSVVLPPPSEALSSSSSKSSGNSSSSSTSSSNPCCIQFEQ
uniref:Uncharacterized protein n=1 Tax=Glossina pallidipes TaxID=7398 RepID=A0A1B0A724_GLOPL